MNKKQKLELTWIGKEKRPRLEPRILLEDAELSYKVDAANLEAEGATGVLFSDAAEDRTTAFEEKF